MDLTRTGLENKEVYEGNNWGWNFSHFQFDPHFYWLQLVPPRFSRRKRDITFIKFQFFKTTKTLMCFTQYEVTILPLAFTITARNLVTQHIWLELIYRRYSSISNGVNFYDYTFSSDPTWYLPLIFYLRLAPSPEKNKQEKP